MNILINQVLRIFSIFQSSFQQNTIATWKKVDKEISDS